jgi:hypothetical protein
MFSTYKSAKYIRSRKHSTAGIMDSAILVVMVVIQALINNNISSSIFASYNPILSLPSQSSNIHPVQFNQNNTYGKQEESEEIHETHKGDIAE